MLSTILNTHALLMNERKNKTLEEQLDKLKYTTTLSWMVRDEQIRGPDEVTFEQKTKTNKEAAM